MSGARSDLEERYEIERGESQFSNLTEADLDLVADELYDRPRKTLNYRTPTEVLNDPMAATIP